MLTTASSPRLLPLALAACLLAGCEHRPAPGGVIDTAGAYLSPEGTYELLVNITPRGAMRYQVREVATGRTMLDRTAVSANVRWFLYWEEGPRLWDYNSETGLAVWALEGSKWRRREVTAGSPAASETPDPVAKNLPEAMRGRLAPGSDGRSRGAL